MKNYVKKEERVLTLSAYVTCVDRKNELWYNEFAKQTH